MKHPSQTHCSFLYVIFKFVLNKPERGLKHKIKYVVVECHMTNKWHLWLRSFSDHLPCLAGMDLNLLTAHTCSVSHMVSSLAAWTWVVDSSAIWWTKSSIRFITPAPRAQLLTWTFDTEAFLLCCNVFANTILLEISPKIFCWFW